MSDEREIAKLREQEGDAGTQGSIEEGGMEGLGEPRVLALTQAGNGEGNPAVIARWTRGSPEPSE